ncbi:MAG TPA: SDR family NAD(P)-dependent oxidoreductase, partial [Vicinamibacterales bacterium]|nr:SDR family NAD(P)-dependent oxidoreductase [Vicinamibacterales bacterium]
MSPPTDVVLITGAAGFVGANLTRRLVERGATVHVLARPSTSLWRLDDVRAQVTVHVADLTDREAVARAVAAADPAVVFHLAKHRGNPAALDYDAAWAANLRATEYLLQAVRGRRLRRFVHAGSSLEYDLARSPLCEADAPAPATVHGVTKAAASLLCQQFARQHGVPAVVLRFFTVYGPWEGPTRFIPAVMMAAIDRGAVQVTRDGLAHDRIHVDDVVDACERAAATGGLDGEIINVATGRQSSNEDVVSIVERLAGRPIVRAAEPFPMRAWDTSHWVADVTKARARLGWRARLSLDDGLAETYAWFSRHAAHYRGP